MQGSNLRSNVDYDTRKKMTDSFKAKELLQEIGFNDQFIAATFDSDPTGDSETYNRSLLESLKEHRSKAEMEGSNLTDEQLSILTFGQKPGHICGLGRGPKPTLSATGKRTRAQLEREASESLKRAEAAEKEVIEARKETA